MFILMMAIGVFNEIEDLRDIIPNFLIRGYQTKIGIELGGFLIKIACSDVTVSPITIALFSDHANYFVVHFQSRHAKYDVHAFIHKAIRPTNIRLLIKARL